MHPPSGSQFQKTVNRMAWSSGCQNRQPDDQAIRFTIEIVNRMGGASGSHFQKIKPDGLVIRLGRGGILLRQGYLCNFMKGSYGIKKLYGGVGRGYGGGGRICPQRELQRRLCSGLAQQHRKKRPFFQARRSSKQTTTKFCWIDHL